MSENLNWLDHKGKKILYACFSGTKNTEEFLERIEAMEKEIMKHKENPGTIYTITDVTGCYIIEPIKKRFDELAEHTNGISKARATVGIKGIQMIIARAIKRDIHFAKSIDDAKDWLVTQ
ncbi:MAG: hypothetical protein JW969_13360 [Spirochaetales bacterium]|nr:hypothetical protein [Spirochaetales bacterium]